MNGVQVGDIQAVGHHGPRRRAAARSHRDIVGLGVADKIRHDQEIVHKAHADYHIQLHPKPVLVVLAGVGIAAPETLLAQLFQKTLAVPVPVLRELKFRQVIFAELELHLT